MVTRADAVTIRAEEGRAVSSVDVSPFIRELPGGRPTTAFTTENASGSTSQAASIVEALEAGSQLLLMDEDTSATNLIDPGRPDAGARGPGSGTDRGRCWTGYGSSSKTAASPPSS